MSIKQQFQTTYDNLIGWNNVVPCDVEKIVKGRTFKTFQKVTRFSQRHVVTSDVQHDERA
jgi:hypothetical protein